MKVVEFQIHVFGRQNNITTLEDYAVVQPMSEDERKRLFNKALDNLVNTIEEEFIEGEIEVSREVKLDKFIIKVIQEYEDCEEKIDLEDLKVLPEQAFKKLPILDFDIEEIEREICISCDSAIVKYIEYTFHTKDGAICLGCMEQDEGMPIGTVIYSEDPDFPCTFGSYHDNTNGDFKGEWHSTDPWRGYYNIKPSDDWEELHSDCILMSSKDSENLKEFDDALIEALDELDIKWARVISRTSNVCSSGYDFFVEAGKHDQAVEINEKLEEISGPRSI